MIKNGADINAEIEEERNVLDKFLSDYSGSLEYSNRRDKEVMEVHHKFNYIFFQILLKNGAKLYSNVIDRATSFILRSEQERAVSEHEQINEVDEQGNTLLCEILLLRKWLRIKPIEDAVVYLLQNGAHIGGNSSAVINAVQQKYSFNIIEQLIEQCSNFNINTQHDDGSTLLMKYSGESKAVYKLLAMGADLWITDVRRRTALDIAFAQADIHSVSNLMSAAIKLAASDPNEVSFLCKMCSRGLIYAPLNELQTCIEELNSCLMAVNINLKTSVLQNVDLLPKALWPRFEGSNCELLTFTFHYYLTNKHEIDINQYVEIFIQILLKHGLKVSHTPPESVTALTAFLATNKNINNEVEKNVITYLIQQGFNIESSALTINSAQRFYGYHTLRELKIQFKLPDVLLLAFTRKRSDLVTQFLPHWWCPPLALMIFYHKQSLFYSHAICQDFPFDLETYEEYTYWLSILMDYGGIPHGTKLYKVFESCTRDFQCFCFKSYQNLTSKQQKVWTKYQQYKRK
jgi:hypothetical protein